MAIDRESGLPVVPHEVADPSVECDGCLIVKYRGDRADLICNECSALIRTVPADQVETALTEMLWQWRTRQRDVPALRTCQHIPGLLIHAGLHLLRVR
jgi:hypothetical protein